MGAVSMVMLALSCVIRAQDIANNVGPSFNKEPPGVIEFINTLGTHVDCAANGHPFPSVTWVLVDGSPVTNISGIRHILINGTLILHPFRSEQYRPDIHAAMYRCMAKNIIGTINSIDVQIRAVLQQSYDVQVYDTYAMEGNTAVFKCHVPVVIKEYIQVEAWIKNDNLLIQSREMEGSSDKYAIMPNGALHIRDINSGDAGTKYKCKTIHRLTNETKVSSSAGQLFVTEFRGKVRPKILDSETTVIVKQGNVAMLPCVAQGNPTPDVKWYTKTKHGQLKDVPKDFRYVPTSSALIIQDVQPSDGALYSCEATSELGKENVDITLNVASDITVRIIPKENVVKLGETASFNCQATGQNSLSITWLHNGSPIDKQTGRQLKIHNVQVSEQGMYQCILKSSDATLQSSSVLRLSGIMPQWIETFQEVAIYPGSPVFVQCISTGIPLPTISWSIDGLPINGSLQHTITSTVDQGRAFSGLTMNSVVVEDGGLYSCTASNTIGDVRHSARINVYGEIHIRNVPTLFVISGEDVSLNCPIYGYPWKSVHWEKAGKRLPAEVRHRMMGNGSLIIKNVRRSADNGKFTCRVESNGQKKVEGFVNLHVMVPPKIIPFAFLDDQFYKGMRAHITCAISQGDLPIAYKWLKDGVTIPSELEVVTRKYDAHTESLSIENVSSKHSGNYSCVVQNKAGTTSHTAQLLVRVRPKIVPFTVRDVHYEGAPARLVCGLLEGDAPIQFAWLKDDLLINNDETISIHHIDGLSSILSIGSLASEHAGNYTCVASNAAGSTSHSVNLRVNVPPSWKLQPKDKTVVYGDQTMLHCEAEGFPKPTITWLYEKSMDDATEIQETLQDTNNIHIFENGTLLIEKTLTENTGYYYCVVSNGIGDGLSQVVQVQVYVPPHFEQRMQTMSGQKGKAQHLNCVSKGDTPLSIHWYKDNKKLNDQSNRHHVVTTSTETGISSEMIIKHLTRRDNGTYNCVAKNNHGSDKNTIILMVLEHPDEPKNVKVSHQGGQDIALEWEVPYNGNLPIKAYIIRYFESGDNLKKSTTATGIATIPGQQTTATITSLRPATSYFFKVSAENKEGRGRESETINATTTEEAPTGPPLNVQVESTDHETIKVSWKPPNEQTWNGRLQGYYVGFKEMDSMESYTFKTLLTADPTADDLSVQIGLKKRHAKYSVVVQAYNNKGKGPLSEPVMVMTSEGAPKEAPNDVRCTTLTSQSIHITWGAPSLNSVNGILKGYKVIYRQFTDWFDETPERSNTSYSTTTTLHGLDKYTNYSIQVLAFTKSGDGPMSEPVFCKTHDDVPDPAMDIKAVTASGDSVIVSWKSPENQNGVLKSYTIYWSKNDEKKGPCRKHLPTQ